MRLVLVDAYVDARVDIEGDLRGDLLPALAIRSACLPCCRLGLCCSDFYLAAATQGDGRRDDSSAKYPDAPDRLDNRANAAAELRCRDVTVVEREA